MVAKRRSRIARTNVEAILEGFSPPSLILPVRDELSDAPATCSQMKRIDLAHLAWVLDNLTAGRVVNRISVPANVADDARVALKRMISIKATVGLTAGSSGQGKEKGASQGKARAWTDVGQRRSRRHGNCIYCN